MSWRGPGSETGGISPFSTRSTHVAFVRGSPVVTTEVPWRRRVVVADDDTDVREAMIDLLQDDPAIEVVAGAADGVATVEACLAHLPDVLVVDVNMPAGGGEHAARTLTGLLPQLFIIAISANADRVTRRRMVAAGAGAFVAKGSMGDLLPLVVEGRVHDG